MINNDGKSCVVEILAKILQILKVGCRFYCGVSSLNHTKKCINQMFTQVHLLTLGSTLETVLVVISCFT